MQLSWKGLFISCSHMLLPLTLFAHVQMVLGPLWSSSYSSWIYNYLCNQCISPITLWVWTPLRWGVLDTMLCDKICQWLAAGQWFSPGYWPWPYLHMGEESCHFNCWLCLNSSYLDIIFSGDSILHFLWVLWR
jgi:hypothetical protein